MIDARTVIFGSLNVNQAAAHDNDENLLTSESRQRLRYERHAPVGRSRRSRSRDGYLPAHVESRSVAMGRSR